MVDIIQLKDGFGFSYSGERIFLYKEVNFKWKKINSMNLTKEMKNIIEWILNEKKKHFPSYVYLSEYIEDLMFELRRANLIIVF